MSKSLPNLVLALAVVLLITAFVLQAPSASLAGNAFEATRPVTATTTASNAVTVSEQVMATSTGYTRVYASVCNPNANPVYLRMDADKAASASAATVVIAAAAGYNACYEITDRNLYQGAVQASSTNQTSTTLTIHDYWI